MRHVTIKDIARIAGVSTSTVSRALSGSKELSEATRERIVKICNEQAIASTRSRAVSSAAAPT